MIPIVIVSFNNYKYVSNMVKQIENINSSYSEFIKIMDNNSTCVDTINYLNSVREKVIFNKTNSGPWIAPGTNANVYNMMPNKFILTDPDLEFNPNLPKNFIEIMIELSNRHNSGKIGFALDISDHNKMFQGKYHNNETIYDWEKRFWTTRIDCPDYELYNASLDTTFCLITKNLHTIEIRIAGNFTAKHIPWYIDNKLYNRYENYVVNKKQTDISTISRVIVSFVENSYNIITKRNQSFLINKGDPIPSFDDETLDILDRNTNGIFIDIGANDGGNTMYATRLCKYVYSIELDKIIFNQLTKNCHHNSGYGTYTLLNNIDDFMQKHLINICENDTLIIKINIDDKDNKKNILDSILNHCEKNNIKLCITNKDLAE